MKDKSDISQISQEIAAIQSELERTLDINAQDLKGLIQESGSLDRLLAAPPIGQADHLTGDLEQDLIAVSHRLGLSDDLVVRRFNIGGKQNLRAAIIFVDGLAEKERIHEEVMKPLMLLNHALMTFDQSIEPEQYIELIRNHSLTTAGLRESRAPSASVSMILEGDTLLLIDGLSVGFLVATKGWADRGVEEPSTESVIRGS